MTTEFAVADLGNSALKIALFRGPTLRAVRRFSWREDPAALNRAARWLVSAGITGLRLISVNPAASRRLARALSRYRITLSLVPHRLPAGMKSRYALSKIGMDRLSNIVAARFFLGHKNIAIFDSGTALTCDLISGNTHSGGYIGAGYSTLLAALHDRTGQLPRLGSLKPRPPIRPGRSTVPAMKGGAWLEFAGYARAALGLAEKGGVKRYQVIVTGRGPDPFSGTSRKHLRDPYLTLKGVALLASPLK